MTIYWQAFHRWQGGEIKIQEITGMGIGDMFDLTTSVQYEIEQISYPKHIRDRAKQYARIGVEVIVIPVGKLPKDIKEREKALKDYIWEE